MRLTLNGNRKVVGTLRGYDPFLNVVLEEAVDEKSEDLIAMLVVASMNA